MGELATIGALLGTVGSLLSSNKTLPADVRDFLLRAQEALTEVQTSNFALQQELLDLKQANMDLEANLKECMSRKSEKEKYEYQQFGKSRVIVPKGVPDAAAHCPACFDEDRFVPLQPTSDFMTSAGYNYACPKCKARFWLDPPKPA